MYQIDIEGVTAYDNSEFGFITKDGNAYIVLNECYDQDKEVEDYRGDELTPVRGTLVKADDPCDEGGQWFHLRYKSESLPKINSWIQEILDVNVSIWSIKIKEVKK